LSTPEQVHRYTSLCPRIRVRVEQLAAYDIAGVGIDDRVERVLELGVHSRIARELMPLVAAVLVIGIPVPTAADLARQRKHPAPDLGLGLVVCGNLVVDILAETERGAVEQHAQLLGQECVVGMDEIGRARPRGDAAVGCLAVGVGELSGRGHAVENLVLAIEVANPPIERGLDVRVVVGRSAVAAHPRAERCRVHELAGIELDDACAIVGEAPVARFQRRRWAIADDPARIVVRLA